MAQLMTRRRVGSALVAAVALGLALVPGADLRAEDPTSTDAPPADAHAPSVEAAFVTIDGEIDQLTERTFYTRVGRALESKPRFLVVSISSPGGLVESSRNIAWSLKNLESTQVVAWIRGRALSGATFVAFGCDLIAMRRGDAQLGDAMPISIDLTGALQPEVAEKFIVPVKKDLRDLATTDQSYPGDVAEAMVDPRVELHRVDAKDPKTGLLRSRWLKKESLAALSFDERQAIVADEVVTREGQLLVVNPIQAQEMGICRLICDDEAQLLADLATEFSTGPIVATHVPALWWEHVVRFVTWLPVKIALFIIGAIALAMTLAHPGTGAPEVVTALCFGAFFFGSYLIGLADYVEATLFVVGVVCLAVELFTPGFGVLGFSGLALIGAALLLSFQTFVIPGSDAEWAAFRGNLLWTTVTFLGTLVGLLGLARYLPQTRLMRGLVLDPAAQAPAAPQPTAAEELVPVGTPAEAVTYLRPVGKVKVGLDVFDAVAEDGFLAAGAPVVVTGHRSAQLVVAGRPEARLVPASAPEVSS